MIHIHPIKLYTAFSLVMGVAIVRSPALAETRTRSNVIYVANESELPTVHSQAMTIAQTELNQGFLDPTVTVMRVGISGEWSGQIVPLYQIQIKREDWLKNTTIGPFNGQVWNSQHLLAGRQSMPTLNPNGVVAPIAQNPIKMREQEDNFYPNR